MATLTQCLVAALVPASSPVAGAVEAGMGPVRARAVLSVLAGAARSADPAAVRRAGGRGATAALVRAVLPLRPVGKPAEQLRAAGGDGAQGGRASGRARVQGGPSLRAGVLQKPARVHAPSGGRGMPHPMGRSARAGSGPAAHIRSGADGPVAGGAPEGTRETPPPQRPGSAEYFPAAPAPKTRVASATAPNTPACGCSAAQAGVFQPDGQLAAGVSAPMVLAGCGAGGGAPGGQAFRNAGQLALTLLLGRGVPSAPGSAGGKAASGLHDRRYAGPVQAGSYPAGFMAGVLQGGVAGGAAPACLPDYLSATSRAVGFASAVAPLRVPPAPTVQAQITVNATGGTARAIGDELEQRMDTLRMQARQANMGQF